MKNKLNHQMITKRTPIVLSTILGFSMIPAASMFAQETKEKHEVTVQLEAKKKNKQQQVFSLLNETEIPHFETRDVKLETILKFLQIKIREHSGKHIHTSISRNLLKEANNPLENKYKFSIKKQNSTALELLQAIIEAEPGIEFSITDDGVILRKASGPIKKFP